MEISCHKPHWHTEAENLHFSRVWKLFFALANQYSGEKRVEIIITALWNENVAREYLVQFNLQAVSGT